MSRAPALAALLALAGSSCSKVPVFNVQASFTLADAAWFAGEETLFVFYQASAEQGIGDPSVIEITYVTDNGRTTWTPLETFTDVHTHLAVDCGAGAVCGSASLHVPAEPREVDIRLRYHRDGNLSLHADTVFNVVDAGPAWSNRSLVVYGVFDEPNERVQWRGRHRFPTLRNEQAEALGLRRAFTVRDQRYGDGEPATSDNPYGYGVSCPADFADAGAAELWTDERAAFNPEALPAEAYAASQVCAETEVTDATGTFTTGATALKNPQVRPAYPVLRSPIHEATPIRFFLAPCQRTISPEHEAMQRQRLMMEDEPTTCTEGWETDAWVDALTVALTDAVEAARTAGDDMVLILGLHRDQDGLADAVEEALTRLVPEERHQTTPRLVGAFVFDSQAHRLSEALEPSVLWCPARPPSAGDDIPGASSLYCPLLPDDLNVELGPFTFGVLPVLPSRDQYLDFIALYSEAQAGGVDALSFRAPEFATTAEHIDVGDYGVATFLNGEAISADGDDAFSYCVGEEQYFFVFRSEIMQSDIFRELVTDDCEDSGFSESLCELAALGLLTVDWLPEWHNFFGEDAYALGLFWDFPFLLHIEYELVTAGSVSAFGLSVPFGIGESGEAYVGTQMWTSESFPLEDQLTQCSRFCDHPTFDGAGVYHVSADFRSTYASRCYLPAYPEPGDSGFPFDP